MQSNPFAPPQALVEDIPDVGLQAQARRPLSVWTMQAASTIVACVISLVALLNAWELVAGTQSSRYHDHAVLEMGTYGAVAVLLLATAVASQRRRRLARWAGLALIALVFLMLVWLIQELVADTFKTTRGAMPLGAMAFLLMFAGVTLLPTAFWFWSFGFSANARAWFMPSGALPATGHST